MVEFGKRLSQQCAQQGADWQSHCIDYEALKRLIEREKNDAKKNNGDATTTKSACASCESGGAPANDDDDATKFSSLFSFPSFAYDDDNNAHYYHRLESGGGGGGLAEHPTLRFRYALDREIEKAVLFVLREQGDIAAALDELAARRARFVDDASDLLRSSRSAALTAAASAANKKQQRPQQQPPRIAVVRAAMEELGSIHSGYASAARSVLGFVAFVDLNVTAVRKILKKHDKITKDKLSYSYLSAYVDEYADSHLDQLYNDGGLSSLVATLRRAFKELRHVELELARLLREREGEEGESSSGGRSRQPSGHRRIKSMPFTRDMASSPVERQQTMEAPPSAGSAGGEGNSASLVTTEKEPLLQLIQLSRHNLRKNTKYVDIVAAQALMFAEPDDSSGVGDDGSPPSEMTDSQRLSSLLNLLSTFLYMTNYYIVAPTCGSYAARVGSSESMAGMVIGMTPNAALVATILYGWWSNHSYKSALVFAAACSFAGNVAYALALRHDSIRLILIGRALNGFGSARSINRRFIADTFSKRNRTAASAAFVTAGALGMACGPALAAFLSRLVFPPESTLWTVETAPGWIMMCLWSLYLVASVVLFEEPDRRHIFGARKKKPSLLELAGVVAKDGEDRFLLADNPRSSSGESEPTPKEPPLWRNAPVMITLWVYFILKLVLEALMSSSPTLTRFYFGWDAQATGFFLAFLGLLMFPANMIVARLSLRFEDREIIYFSLVAILCSVFGIISFVPARYSVAQYLFFGICIFISTNALEGPNMSLLSKSIPKSWAKGIFNTGFLATEAGTLARSVGDLWITLASDVVGVPGLLNSIFVPALALVAASVALVRQNYDCMVEDDEDDTKSK